MTPLIFPTVDAIARKAAEDFVVLTKEILPAKNRMTVALSGGTTPKLFYQILRDEPFRSQIPWEKLWIFWSDERCVPPDHQESNYRLAREALLQYVPIPPNHIFRLKGEEQPPEAARQYEKDLHTVFGETLPEFDLLLLGMGPDGHTASLFPGTDALKQESRWVVENVVRSLQTVRLTFTLPLINNARHIWYLVTGAKKQDAFACVQQGPNPNCPASLVIPKSGEVRWYIDETVIKK